VAEFFEHSIVVADKGVEKLYKGSDHHLALPAFDEEHGFVETAGIFVLRILIGYFRQVMVLEQINRRSRNKTGQGLLHEFVENLVGLVNDAGERKSVDDARNKTKIFFQALAQNESSIEHGQGLTTAGRSGKGEKALEKRSAGHSFSNTAKNLLPQGINISEFGSGKLTLFVKANQLRGELRPPNFTHASTVPLVGIDKGREKEDHFEIRRKRRFLSLKFAPVSVEGKVDLPPGVEKLF
jgi:hypothetical protein